MAVGTPCCCCECSVLCVVGVREKTAYVAEGGCIMLRVVVAVVA